VDANAESRGEKELPSEEMPREFGDYELLEEIGRGGQGVVFRAWQRSLSRTVALKIIGVGQFTTNAHLKRLRREAEAVAKLNHPGIVPIYEVGERDGTNYFSMRFVEGDRLDEVVSRGPISVRQAAELTVKVARTVHFAHEHGILHRDIKPGNILLDANGEPHLTDFGLARLIEQGSTVTGSLEVMGTPSYMAPEQAVGNNSAVGSATDVYGLGAVLYELLTGHPPFAGGTTYETIRLLLDSEPRPPRSWNQKIDRDLSDICLKCLEKNPRYRYSSALALAEDVERWLRHEPIRAKRSGFLIRSQKWVRRNPMIAALMTLSVVLAAGLGVMVWQRESLPRISAGIAVLPFENLSDDKEDAFFADGVQDDVLTKLASIADLKVISRTSVMHYRSKRDLRQIGRALGVTHVLEGTARRSGGEVHVNAQLVDTRTNTGVWADGYDRDAKEAFAIPSEIAQNVAEQLHAKITTSEKAAIRQPPTNDLGAYDLYVRATPLIDQSLYYGLGSEQNLFKATELLNKAVERDPAFLLAYCKLAQAQDGLYWTGIDRTLGRLTSAKAAIDSAFRLNPESGDAHLASALHFYYGYLDYNLARGELAIALRTLPNNARIFELNGYIDRRQGRWRDAVSNLARAMELDPQNGDILFGAGFTYLCLRDYKRAREISDRAIALPLKSNYAQLLPTWIDFHERADTRSWHAVLEKILSEDPASARDLTRGRFFVSRYERDSVAAERALETLDYPVMNARGIGNVKFSPAFAHGLVADMQGDAAGAYTAFSAARAQQDELVRNASDDASKLCFLGLIDAELGRKEEALREGWRAVELLPATKDALNGTEVLYFYAVTCARTGELDRAIEQLETLAKLPAGISYGEIRLDPFWDPLRGDPRFEKIIASLAPK
jgi:serine/threonine protein kinase/tetratricopeptide (TPR) repeat protein